MYSKIKMNIGWVRKGVRVINMGIHDCHETEEHLHEADMEINRASFG